jgi:hypothetical protein
VNPCNATLDTFIRPYNTPTKSLPSKHSIADIASTTSVHSNSNLKLLPIHRTQHMSFLRTAPLRSLLNIRTFTTATRIMAPKQEWLVILPDQSGKLAERNQVRAYVLAQCSNYHIVSEP